MTVLLENLGNNDVHRLVKPPILSVFGDIALAVGPIFQKYLDVVLTTLMQASQAQVDRVCSFLLRMLCIFMYLHMYISFPTKLLFTTYILLLFSERL